MAVARLGLPSTTTRATASPQLCELCRCCQQAEASRRLPTGTEPRAQPLGSPAAVTARGRQGTCTQRRLTSSSGLGQVMLSSAIHQSPKKLAPQIPLHCPAVPLCVLLLKLQVPSPSAPTSLTETTFPLSERHQHSLQSSLLKYSKK